MDLNRTAISVPRILARGRTRRIRHRIWQSVVVILAVTSAPSRSSAHCRLTDIERAALGDAADILGEPTFDIHLNDNARWSNVPAAVWNYRLGGYQILKK